MNRRDILALFGGTLLLADSLNTDAQDTKGVRRIGVLHSDTRVDDASWLNTFAPLLAQLRERGWVYGRNLLIERRSGGGNVDLLRQSAEELVRLNVELIVTTGTPPTVAAKNATTRIPILMIGRDPVSTGLVTSLGKPGGNITGFSNYLPELEGKLLALLRELVPGMQRVGVPFNPANVYWEMTRSERLRTYQSLGIQPIFVEVAAASQIESAVGEARRRRAQALAPDIEGIWQEGNYEALIRAAQRHSLPVAAQDIQWVEAGALLSLDADPDGTEGYRAIAYMVDKILRGAKPADLPIQQPTKFALYLNIKTAKTHGLTIPQSLLLRADRVFQ